MVDLRKPDIMALATKPFVRKLLPWLGAGLALIAIIGFLVVPPVLKSVLVRQMSEKLRREVSVGKVEFNPFTLAVKVTDFSMKERGGSGTFLTFRELYLNFEVASVFRMAPVLRDIVLFSPTVSIVRSEDLSYNFSDILEEFASRPSAGSKPLRYSLNNIQIVDGSIDFDDRPKRTRHAVRDLRVAIPFFSNLPYYVDAYIQPVFIAKVNGTPVDLRGRTKPFSDSRETSFDVNVSDFSIPHYLEYVPIKLKFKVASALLDTAAVLSFREYKDRPPILGLAGKAALKDVRIADMKGKKVLALPLLDVYVSSSDFFGRKAGIGSVLLRSLEVHLWREGEGALNLVSLMPPQDSGGDMRRGSGEGKEDGAGFLVETAEVRLDGVKITFAGDDFLNVPETVIRDAVVDTGKRTISIGGFSTRDGRIVAIRESVDAADSGILSSRAAPPAPADPVRPAEAEGASAQGWLIALKKAAVDRYSLKIEDRSASPPVVLSAEPLDINAEDLSTVKGAKGKASLRMTLNRRGKFHVAGSVGLNPLSVNLGVDVKEIGIIPLQPYFTEKVRIAVTSGSVYARGNLALGIAADDAFTARYRGEAGVAEFASVDKANSEEFLAWKSLHLGGIDLDIHPLRVEIGEIALADFNSRIAVNPDGTLNVQHVFAGEPKGPPGPTDAAKDNVAAPQAAGKAKPVRIDRVTVQGGTIHFSDRHVRPNYVAHLSEMGGRISGLSSDESRFADVDLRGKLENYAPLEITGKINPLRDDLYVDLKADFKDIDLSPLTPYSGKYAGYAIEKGKITLALRYLITKRTVDSSNHVFIDQFTFGNQVESPDATKLPVKLAVALLKDRKGEINLDIPVSGSLDDPRFSIWGVVVRIIVNLLVKAATSPFALLGAIFGGGEELGCLEFDYGKSDLSAAMAARIGTLEKVLFDRPGLKLEIAGRVDPAKDREGLLRTEFDRKIRAQKMAELAGKGEAPASPDNVTVAQAEYPKYLAQAYRKEKFPKPRNIIGIAKDLPVPEMEKLMLTNIRITDDDLRLLAMRRAQVARDALLKQGRVPPERIFLVEPKTLSPEKKEKIKDSRVDFLLK